MFEKEIIDLYKHNEKDIQGGCANNNTPFLF